MKEMGSLGLMEGPRQRPLLQLERRTTSLVDESRVYGRDADREAIIKMLISDESDAGNVDCPVVIPILGMGGIGKTTLTQLVYRDDRVKAQFQLQAWVCVSEEFDVFKVTRNVLKELGDTRIDGLGTLNLLHNELEKKLKGQRFFIILDDIWDERQTTWDTLKMPFKSGAHGSKIIVTTRSKNVAAVVSPTKPYLLKVLSDDHCWSLFARKALGGENFSRYPKLETIGRQIVEKCKGLPLVAKTLGSLLNNERDPREWETILKSNIWDVENDNILPALRLSYHYLPSNLKRCFTFCAIIPKDYRFEKHKLIRLWMAEGLLVQHNQNIAMEEIGRKYFDGLVARSFFQQCSDDSSYFVMHDLINDLAKSISGDFCYTVESNNLPSRPEKLRHISYRRKRYGPSKEFYVIYEANQLRTLIPNDLFQWLGPEGFISTEAIQRLMSLKRLRILSLRQYENIVELPELIGKLKHLRYLDLSITRIKRLPNFVSIAYNLQTLDLEGCSDLMELPDSIVVLKHLHYLNLGQTRIRKLPNMISCLCHLQTLILSRCNNLVELPSGTRSLINLCLLNLIGTNLQHMPLEFGNLKNLQTLTDFFVGNQTGCGMKELRELHYLKGDLSIWNLQNVLDAKDALDADMKDKEHLETLKLSWGGDTTDSLHDKKILEALQPHPSLQHLSITGYGGTSFPEWVGDSSFSNMMSLTLRGCKYCYELPPLGQLRFLKELMIIQCDEISVVGPSFYGNCVPATRKPFESLEFLKFNRMSQWHTWTVKEEAFPRLQKLYIEDCPNLKEVLPSCLPSLTILDIRDCTQINNPFPRAPALVCLMLRHTSGFWSVNLHVKRGNLTVYEVDSLDAVLEGIEQMGVILTNLKDIQINRCSPNLKSLPSLPPSIENLGLYRCPELESFPEEGLPPKLQSLKIRECHKLIANRMQWKLQLLPSLSHLCIGGDPKDAWGSRNGHKEDRMESFPEETLLPSTLTSLELRFHKNLESLQCKGLRHLSALKELQIWNCPQLKSLQFEDGLLPTLTSFKIRVLDSLTSLKGIHCLTSLQQLEIDSCHQLENLPDKGLPCTLTSVYISNMTSINSITGSLKQLTSLQTLVMWGCPKLPSVPEDGLPSTITSLIIYAFKNLKSLKYKGLQHLTCLEELRIEGCPELESVTEDSLPSSLVSLRICVLDNLATLHYKGFEHLSSLSKLEIDYCLNLQSLPEEGLPSSLSDLVIRRCPLLAKRCYCEGEDWPKISHIPNLQI